MNSGYLEKIYFQIIFILYVKGAAERIDCSAFSPFSSHIFHLFYIFHLYG
mgnify:CR=1 FL=1